MSPSSLDAPWFSHLPPPALVLDIGCGTGHHAHELARTGYIVVAVDMDFDAVATGHELSESTASSGAVETPYFLTARAEELPFPDATFDAVVCLDVLHWSANAAHFEGIWNEAWRTLRRGGLFQVRCLLRDALPSALPLVEGRYRLDTGAEWFLPDRVLLDTLLERLGGIWLLPPEAGAQGAATMTARKPTPH
jgi:SAM-dependent methyltransferase